MKGRPKAKTEEKKVNKEMIDKLETCFNNGIKITPACKKCGVHYATVREYMNLNPKWEKKVKEMIKVGRPKMSKFMLDLIKKGKHN